MGRYHPDFDVDDAYERIYDARVLFDPPTSATIARYGFGSGAAIEIVPVRSERFVVTVVDRLPDVRLLSWPDPAVLVVLPSATVVDVRDPGAMQSLAGLCGRPVRFHHGRHAPDVVVLASDCGIACYDASGMRWQRDDVFCCRVPTFTACGDDVVVRSFVHGLDTPDPELGETPTAKIIDVLTGVRRS